ncbi:MAG: SDR family NAD(P)-dependent oxidoreductase, partial [bacterium]
MKQKKVAIVIGASGGIGRSVALKLNKEGFIVVCVGRNKKRLQNILK